MHDQWFSKHVRVEKETDSVSALYGHSGIVVAADAAKKTMQMVCEKHAHWVSVEDVHIRTNRECLTAAHFGFNRTSEEK